MDLLLGIIITATMYMICPLIIFIKNIKYEKTQIRNILIVNSVFICLLDNLLALLLIENFSEIKIIPAFIYFFINYAIWSRKSVSEDNIQKQVASKENIIATQTTKEKYENLEKLKDLYDKKIITKEEFEKEKNKLLQ